MPPTRRANVYFQMASASAGHEADLWYVSNILTVPRPFIVTYHTQQLQGDFRQRLHWLAWQVAFVEWAVFCLLASLDTAQNGVHANFRVPYAGI